MMVASWLPWHISIRKGIQIYVGTVMGTYGMPTLLLVQGHRSIDGQ
jgi:hypothetical protein